MRKFYCRKEDQVPPDEFSIPRIQLPQIGQPDPSPVPLAEQGAVRKADDHHERFLRYLDTGDGLDNLIDGVHRDTVGSDGRTPGQRESEAEQAHQEAVLHRNAAAAPTRKPRSQGFFDDDECDECDEDFSDSGSTTSVPALYRRTLTPPAAPPSGERTPPVPDMPAPASTDGAFPANDDDPDPEDVYDVGDSSSEDDGFSPSHDEPAADDSVLPPGSLWDNTHGTADTYDPGTIVVDPAPQHREPGPLSTWIHDQYQRRWIPLSLVHKASAIIVVVALTVWGGYVLFGSAKAAVPHSQPAEPLVDTAAPPSKPAPAPLPPDSVRAPACAARSTPPVNAFSGKAEDAWVCVRVFGTDLQTITITYSKPVVVCSIFVIPGFEHTDSNGRSKWNEHRVVTLINWHLGGQQFQQNIDPNAHTGATIQIPCLATQAITGTIFKTVPPPPIEGDNGPSDEDINSTFAVKAITINGYPAGGMPR
jgi:hypothetical protein